ncbi:hypothetical protein RJT34_05612 [Clitoria ternatea]|uniref:BHLH domain-containing protein n=1 Tax=Clitoria ternatea TaxID=43366 RepID=A0AAN9PT78_CLITE
MDFPKAVRWSGDRPILNGGSVCRAKQGSVSAPYHIISNNYYLKMMEIASNYFPELGMEDPTFYDQYPMDSFAAYTIDDFDFQSFSESNDSSYPYVNSKISTPNCIPTESTNHSVIPARQTKRLKAFTTCKASISSPSSKLISFEHFNATSASVASQQFLKIDSIVKPKFEKVCSENMAFAGFISQGDYDEEKSFLSSDNRANQIPMATRNPIQAQEHVIAERKRREKLSQKFIALSAILPGLKKMDKASVLGDAIKYVKQLQERVQTLEEQAAKKKTFGSAVLVKRSILFANDDNNSSLEENCASQCHQPLPEIEVRVSGNDVLIKTRTDKHSGRAQTLIRELENLHLTVQNSSFLPFGKNNIDVTIIAQMNMEKCMTAKDLLGRLRQALL